MPLTPETWLANFTANLTTAGAQFDPQVIQLANGNILVSWTSNNDTGVGSDAGFDIIGQIFDPLGTPIGAEFRVNSFFVDDEQNVSLAAMTDGGFIAVYEDTDISTGVVSLRLQEFNADGSYRSVTSVEDDISTAFDNFSNPQVAVSSATSAMIVYEIKDADGKDVYYKIYDPSTDTMGAQTLLMTSLSVADLTDLSITVLTNGNYVVSAALIDSTDGAIAFRVVSPAGVAVGGVESIASTFSDGEDDYGPSITALTGGGFVITWTNFDNVDTDILF